MIFHPVQIILPSIVAMIVVAPVNAQVIQRSYYSPYGSNTQSWGGTGIPGTSRPGLVIGPGPYGVPTVSYASPFGYVMQPYYTSMPYFFGPGYGLRLSNDFAYGTGYTQGFVDATSSGRDQLLQADAAVKEQQAAVKREIAQGLALDNRKKRFDQFLDERARGPKPEEIQQAQQREQLRRSIVNPTKSEITSGAAMNVILDALVPIQERFKDLPEMPIDESQRLQMNFTKGTGTGSFGLLRLEGKIPWTPGLLSPMLGDTAAKLRTEIEATFADAYRQATIGPVNHQTLKQVETKAEALSDLVSENIRSMDMKDYLEAKRFLKSLEDTVLFLRQPDAGDWLPGKCKFKPKSIQELIRVMSEKGLHFAPALIGNDAAYFAMHHKFVQFYGAAVGPAVPAAPAKK